MKNPILFLSGVLIGGFIFVLIWYSTTIYTEPIKIVMGRLL